MANEPSLKVRITSDLTDIKAALKGLQSDLDKLGKKGKQTGDEVGGGLGKVAGLAKQAAVALGGFAAIYASIKAVSTVAGLADEFAMMNGVLTLSTKSAEEFQRAQKGVYEIAQATRAPVKDTADTYAALERNTRSLGLSQEELLRTLETVNKSISSTPVSAQAAQAALVQFSQAMGGDFKNGSQELNSILEQTPGLAVNIARGLGVETSALKKMGEEGKLSTELVVRGLLRITESVDAEFAKVPQTVSGTLQKLKNDLVFTIGSADMTPLIKSMEDLRAVITDPAVVKGLTEIAAAIVRVTAAAASGAAKVADFAKWLGESAAAAIGGVADNDLPRLSQAIDDVDASLKKARAGVDPFGLSDGLLTGVNDSLIKTLEREKTALEARYAAALKNAEADAVAAARKKGATEEDKKAAAAKAEADFKAAQAAQKKKAADEEARKLAEQRQKQIKDLIANIEEEAATYGKTADEVARYRLQILGANQAQIDAGVAAAKRLQDLKDEAELEKNLIEIAEKRAEAEKKLAEVMQEVKIRTLEATGKGVEARAAQLAKEFDPVIAELRAKGDEAGVELVQKLINVELAQSRLSDLKDKIGETVATMQQAEQTAGARVQAGGDPAIAKADQRAARETAIEQLRRLREQVAALPADTVGGTEALRNLDLVIGEIGAKNLTGIEQAIAGMRAQLAQMQDEFAGDALTSLRDGMAGLFTDIATGSKSAGDALKDFVRGFAQQMAALAARALATFVLLSTLDAIYPGLGRATAAALGVSSGVKHTGGIVGSGITRTVDPLVFAGAPRYHSGGIAGLKPGEVPAILQKGEEVLTKQDPRHQANGGASGNGTRVVNVFDQAFVPDQMNSAAGEKVILNIIGRNPGRVRQLLG